MKFVLQMLESCDNRAGGGSRPYIGSGCQTVAFQQSTEELYKFQTDHS